MRHYNLWYLYAVAFGITMVVFVAVISGYMLETADRRKHRGLQLYTISFTYLYSWLWLSPVVVVAFVLAYRAGSDD